MHPLRVCLPQYEAASRDRELRGLTGIAEGLEPRPDLGSAQGVATEESQSRLFSLERGRITISEGEYRSLVPLAVSLANYDPNGVMAIIADWGKSEEGTIRTLKLIHLLQAPQKTEVKALLRPSEIRIIEDSPVVHTPGATVESTPTALSKETAVLPATRDSKPPEGRFQTVGTGQTAWQTVLDTATGTVYNYRNVGGAMVWVAITTPILSAIK